jgi:hypothetical protein
MIARIRAIAGGFLHRRRARRALDAVLRQPAPDADALSDWSRSLRDPDGYYLDCVRHFHSAGFPAELKEHRTYFQTAGRGFGEDAFHVMWWMIFRELRPEHFLEIGVYRGQTLSLAALLQRRFGIKGSVTGISPFSPAGDSSTSYLEEVDYLEDTLANFARCGLPAPELVRAFSTDPAAVARIDRDVWDAVYIDGNHDYEVAKADWEACAARVRIGGLIVLDDSALGTGYHPPAFATAGHPGPSRVAAEIAGGAFAEVLRVGHNRVFRKLA